MKRDPRSIPGQRSNGLQSWSCLFYSPADQLLRKPCLQKVLPSGSYFINRCQPDHKGHRHPNIADSRRKIHLVPNTNLYSPLIVNVSAAQAMGGYFYIPDVGLTNNSATTYDEPAFSDGFSIGAHVASATRREIEIISLLLSRHSILEMPCKL